MVYYVLKSALLLTLLYGAFTVCLSRETFHRFNRVVLLSIMLASMALPAVHITTERPTAVTLEQYWEPKQYPPGPQATSPASLGASSPWAAAPPHSVSIPFTKELLLPVIYLSGLLFVLLRFAGHAISLARGLRGSMRIKDGQGNTVIIKGGNVVPFSFMHYIVMSLNDYEHHRRLILTHEQAHARLGHSYDVVLIIATEALQWFNPFAWLLGRELRAVHEYEADEAVILQGIDAKQYQLLLVKKAVGNRLQPFANTLNRGSLKQRINMMYKEKSTPWRMLRAAFIIPVAIVALYAYATPSPRQDTPSQQAMLTTDDNTKTMPLVEYQPNRKIGKRTYNTFIVNLGEGVWVEQDGRSHIEEQYFRWSFSDARGKPVMQLNGKPFDEHSLPKLTNHDLKKIEIKKTDRTTVEGYAHGSNLKIEGERQVVNLITTPVTIPAGVEGNVPRVQTLLLPGKGELYIKNGKATPGDWMHSSVTSWEKTSYNYSVRNELERSKVKPGYKCYIYASVETAQKDISRAEALMRKLDIKNYEVVRGLPKKHFTDSELRQWARDEKAKGTAYDKLYDAMAPNHMDCADVHRQWHIVKAVYGKK